MIGSAFAKTPSSVHRQSTSAKPFAGPGRYQSKPIRHGSNRRHRASRSPRSTNAAWGTVAHRDSSRTASTCTVSRATTQPCAAAIGDSATSSLRGQTTKFGIAYPLRERVGCSTVRRPTVSGRILGSAASGDDARWRYRGGGYGQSPQYRLRFSWCSCMRATRRRGSASLRTATDDERGRVVAGGHLGA